MRKSVGLLLASWLTVSCASQAYAQAPLFVLNSLDANISVIDPLTMEHRTIIPTGKEPHHLYLTPDRKSVIVANAAGNSLTFVDPHTAEVQRTIRRILDPYHLRFSPDLKWLVTVANRLNHIDIYKWDGETPTLAKRIPSGITPSHIWIDSKSTKVWATMQDSNELVAVDLATQTLKWRILVGRSPADVFGPPGDKFLFVALTGDKYVQIYDVTQNPAQLVGQIQTGASAHAFRALGDGRHVFVSNRVANTISQIDYTTFKVVRTLPGPGGPDCMEVSADRKKLFISSRWIGRMTIVDLETGKIEKQVKVGKSPHGIFTLDRASPN
jgi:DNA-binding beta-propeller fold protein YncE